MSTYLLVTKYIRNLYEGRGEEREGRRGLTEKEEGWRKREDREGEEDGRGRGEKLFNTE